MPTCTSFRASVDSGQLANSHRTSVKSPGPQGGACHYTLIRIFYGYAGTGVYRPSLRKLSDPHKRAEGNRSTRTSSPKIMTNLRLLVNRGGISIKHQSDCLLAARFVPRSFALFHHLGAHYPECPCYPLSPFLCQIVDRTHPESSLGSG